ncbi:MAG: cell division protein FtsL [bacterium]|nr:cell division protein FtsL [bacterium]
MARFLNLASSGEIQRGKRKKTLRRKVKIGPVALCFVTILLLCLVSLFYLTQGNQVATKGYEIKDLENKLNNLKEENRKLELEAASLQSVRNVEEGAKKLNMVPIEKMSYVTTSGTAVALKKN